MIKTIWSYWDGSPIKLVHECHQSWKKHLPDWEVRLLTPETLPFYWEPPQFLSSLPVNIQSDLIRLALLYIYGGVWLDATVMLRQNLDWLLKHIDDRQIEHFTGYRLIGKQYMESWLIAVPDTNDLLVGKWYETLYKALEKYPNIDHPSQKIPYTKDPNYYLLYHIFGNLIQEDQRFRNESSKLLLSTIEMFTGTHRLQKYTNSSRNIYNNIYVILVAIFFIGLLFVALLISYRFFSKPKPLKYRKTIATDKFY